MPLPLARGATLKSGRCIISSFDELFFPRLAPSTLNSCARTLRRAGALIVASYVLWPRPLTRLCISTNRTYSLRSSRKKDIPKGLYTKDPGNLGHRVQQGGRRGGGQSDGPWPKSWSPLFPIGAASARNCEALFEPTFSRERTIDVRNRVIICHFGTINRGTGSHSKLCPALPFHNLFELSLSVPRKSSPEHAIFSYQWQSFSQKQ